MFQHGRPGLMLTIYAIEVKRLRKNGVHANYNQKNPIYGKGGGFRGQGTLKAGCSADTHWSVPLVKKRQAGRL